MGARQKLNRAHFNGALLCAAGAARPVLGCAAAFTSTGWLRRLKPLGQTRRTRLAPLQQSAHGSVRATCCYDRYLGAV